MADEFNPGPNWWDRTAAPSSSSSSSSSSSVLNNSLGTFGGWNPEMADIKARSPMDSISSSSSSSVSAPDLHMMGLGLSSQAMDWNQAFMRGDHKSETSFKSMLEEHNLNASNPNYHQEMMGFKHQSSSQFSPCSSDSTIINNMDSTSLYGSPSTILQGLLRGTENQTYENRSINYQYGMNNNDPLLPTSWSKVPQFLKNSPQKNGQLHFSNNAPFWNPSAAATSPMVDHRPPGFFPSFPTPNFDEKPKNNISEVKKNGNETSSKRPRNEIPSLPAFKVRKEKLGDRISALQQLVSPFGKTDTASVLSEVIEYIKFLHEQINVLSTPYKKTGATTQQQQQTCEKSKDFEGLKHDLRSRGLCLVPVSSTFPMTHESTVDFWTPTFGGTFR